VTTMCAEDALKYAAALLSHQTRWTSHVIIGSAGCDGHPAELEAIGSAVDEIQVLAGTFGDTLQYSDGRAVMTDTEIRRGLFYRHVWHPDPSREAPRSWWGRLRPKPGISCPGTFEVATDPATQTLHVSVVREGMSALMGASRPHDDVGLTDSAVRLVVNPHVFNVNEVQET